jgi:hypothetical protein
MGWASWAPPLPILLSQDAIDNAFLTSEGEKRQRDEQSVDGSANSDIRTAQKSATAAHELRRPSGEDYRD